MSASGLTLFLSLQFSEQHERRSSHFYPHSLLYVYVLQGRGEERNMNNWER